MKVIALILSLNILVATNGIAIGDHYCSMMDQEMPVQYDSSNEKCCYTTYTDFLKQDVEGNISSSLKLEHTSQLLPVCLLITHIDVHEISLNDIILENHSPPNLNLLTDFEPEQIQVFRC